MKETTKEERRVLAESLLKRANEWAKNYPWFYASGIGKFMPALMSAKFPSFKPTKKEIEVISYMCAASYLVGAYRFAQKSE
ncbi:MAG: hypothetical protein WC359_12345 [Dehalococcoidia bacterium]|jgi:hypothetical protein